MLEEKIKADLTQAMKQRAEFTLGLLRMVIAALGNRSIEKRGVTGSAALTEADVLEVLAKEAKKRREAAVLFKQGKRADLEEKELREAALIETYLPKQLSAAEIEAELNTMIGGEKKDFASLMKEASPKFKGRADGRLVAEIVKRLTG
jgi:uncharacterized protein YqeY